MRANSYATNSYACQLVHLHVPTRTSANSYFCQLVLLPTCTSANLYFCQHSPEDDQSILIETSSCNLQFFSELITTQLRDFHMVSPQVAFPYLTCISTNSYSTGCQTRTHKYFYGPFLVMLGNDYLLLL